MDEDTNVFPLRRLSSRKSKPTMADLVDQHRFGSSIVGATANSYWISSSSPSNSLDNHSPSGNNNHSLSSHVVQSDPTRLHIRIRKCRQRPANNPTEAPAFSAPLPNGSLDSTDILASASEDSETGSNLSNFKIEDPTSSLPSAEEEDEDDLPLSDLCRRVNHPSINKIGTSPPLCAASNCSDPVSLSDERLGGRYCSVECLIRACHQAFHNAFPKISLDQDDGRLDDQSSLKSATPTPFTNPEGLVS